jgi:hypothetical protein
MRVFVGIDKRSSLDPPLGDAVETFLCRADAERFVEDVRRDGSVPGTSRRRASTPDKIRVQSRRNPHR